jgi:hypothetical protein
MQNKNSIIDSPRKNQISAIKPHLSMRDIDNLTPGESRKTKVNSMSNIKTMMMPSLEAIATKEN